MFPSRTVRSLLREAVERLRRKEGESDFQPLLEAEILLAEVLRCERIHLHRDPEREVPEEVSRRYRKKIEERFQGRPMAGILGYRDFHNYRFDVTDVLIPRPETEEMLIDFLENHSLEEGRLLDLCCGSGCIGISAWMERPRLQVDFVDLSPEALRTARKNADAICGPSRENIRFFQSDLFEKVKDFRYDAILCNPPYIHPRERDELSPEVRDHEPAMALFTGDPPGMATQILEEGRKCLTVSGVLYLETAPQYAGELLEQAMRLYHRANLRKDLSGRDRYLAVAKPRVIERKSSGSDAENLQKIQVEDKIYFD